MTNGHNTNEALQGRPAAQPGGQQLESLISDVTEALRERQAEDGHWIYELEADATIPAEYILLNHFLGEPNDEIEERIGRYLRAAQEDHGGWPLFHGGDLDVSASVKVYFALKLVGDGADEPHMVRAREAIRAHGGGAKVNVFTRFALALHGQLPWDAAPVMPVEVMHAPRWFPFHITKISYWSRTVIAPLLILAALKPKAKNPRNVHISELFMNGEQFASLPLHNVTGHWIGNAMLGLDRLLRLVEPYSPRWLRQRAIEKVLHFMAERLNGEDGLGGIFPAMANTVMAYDALGYSRDDPDYVAARKAVDKLLIFKDDHCYCQPCLSPVWDTCLAMHAMQEAGLGADDPAITRAAQWLLGRQVLNVAGDYKSNRRHVRPGGWAFQYWNDYYPDIDDTAVVVMALHRADPEKYRVAIERGAEWVIGMQSKNGGWGAFDADNQYYLLEHIPFADHGALLDPPSADVTARCVSMLAQLGYAADHPVVSRGLEYLRAGQEDDGSWFGRWGTNFIYGTWSVLCALNAAGENLNAAYVRRAVDWLKTQQRDDGGWGEDCATYWQERRGESKVSTPTQTAWAVLGLMAAGEVNSKGVSRGIRYLTDSPRKAEKWDEDLYNAVGFPRIFYLRYHGYSAYFPLWAIARYNSLKKANLARPQYGM